MSSTRTAKEPLLALPVPDAVLVPVFGLGCCSGCKFGSYILIILFTHIMITEQKLLNGNPVERLAYAIHGSTQVMQQDVVEHVTLCVQPVSRRKGGTGFRV